MFLRKVVAAAVSIVACVAISFSSHANEVVVSAVSPTSDDFALSVVWSNLIAKEGGDLQLTVVDNGTVKGLRKLAKGQVDVSVIGAPHLKDATQKSGKFKEDPDSLIAKYADMRALLRLRQVQLNI